jgi:hypothetical protein
MAAILLVVSRMTTHKYNATAKGVMEWANAELAHVGRIAGIEDKDIQYSYALSTVNGMAHLRNALFELVGDSDYAEHKKDLLKTHNAVIRVMKHLIKDYKIKLDTIKQFNVRHVLGSMSYLKRGTRKNKN